MPPKQQKGLYHDIVQYSLGLLEWARLALPSWTEAWAIQTDDGTPIRFSLMAGRRRNFRLGRGAIHWQLGNPRFIWVNGSDGVTTVKILVWGDKEVAERLTAPPVGFTSATRTLAFDLDNVTVFGSFGTALVQGVVAGELQVSLIDPLTGINLDVVDNKLAVGSWPYWRTAGLLGKPTWRRGNVVTAPAAGTALVTVAAVAGQIHRCWGIAFGKEDVAGNFIQVRSAATILGGFSASDISGIKTVPGLPLFESAVGVAMTLNNLNAGAAGIDYWGALLVETAA